MNDLEMQKFVTDALRVLSILLFCWALYRGLRPMSNRDQNELSELYKAMTKADAEAKKRRIEDAKALGVIFFACWVLIGLVALLLVKC